MVELLATVTALRPAIVGVTESWGDADISDSEFSIPGFVMFRSDRDSGHHGGGVLLFVRNELNPDWKRSWIRVLLIRCHGCKLKLTCQWCGSTGWCVLPVGRPIYPYMAEIMTDYLMI